MKLAWDSKTRRDSHDGSYQRVRSDDLYHTYRWTRLARAFIDSHPLCAECARHGITKAAEVADHVIPWPLYKKQGGDFYDERNLQPLCKDCNAAKGNRDKEMIRRGGGSQSLQGNPSRPRPQFRNRKMEESGF